MARFQRGALRSLALQRLAAEGEAGVGERRGQIGRGLVGGAERHPRLDRVERRRAEGRGEPRERVGLTDDEAGAAAKLRAIDQRVPVETRGEGRELGRPNADYTGSSDRAAWPCPSCPRRSWFRRRSTCAAVASGSAQPISDKQLRGISGVGLALLGELGLQIIIAVGQAEAGLVEVDGVAVGRLEVAVDIGRDDRRIEVKGALAHQPREIGAARCAADGVELGRDGGDAEPVDRRLRP